MFPSIAGFASVEGHLIWKPTVGEHTCVKVVITEIPEETSTLDNIAQENVSAFDTSASSPYRAKCNRFRVNNPFENRETPVHMSIRDLPERWTVLIDPVDMVLPPGGSDQVTVVLFPPVPDAEYKPGYVGKPKIEALVPYADTFIPIGGIDIWAHLVEPSRLTCDSNGSTRRRLEPGVPVEEGLAPRELPVSSTAGPKNADEAMKLFRESALISGLPAAVEVGLGGEIVAKGRLDPPLSGARIAVDFTHGESKVVRFVTTGPDGVWQASYDPDEPGIWQVRAFYDGDMIHEAANSNFCRFDVERKKPQDDDEKPRTIWSLHAGLNKPHGDFARLFDGGASFGIDFERPFTDRFTLEAYLGYDRFDGAGEHYDLFEIGSTYFVHLSVNAKATFGSGQWRPFLQAGPGLYHAKGGDSFFGWNAGGGLQCWLQPLLAVEAYYSFHQVDGDIEYSTFVLGLRRKF